MRVVAALADEESLPAVAERGARLDHPRDAHQLARDVAGQRRAGGVLEILVGGARRRGDDAVGGRHLRIGRGDAAGRQLGHLAERGAVGEGGDAGLAGHGRRVGRRGVVAAARQRAGRRQDQRRRCLADHRQLRPRDRDHRRGGRSGRHLVGQPPHESVVVDVAGPVALPVRLLVGMAHQVGRAKVRALLVERLGQRLVERAGVEDDVQRALAPRRLQRREARMQAEVRPRQLAERRGRQRERRAARRGVGRVARVGRHDHVPAVVAAEQEDADHRPEVRRRGLRHRRRQAELAERGERAGAAEEATAVAA